MLQKISVLIPVLNGEKHLARCLHSILAQDVPLHEVIIVDNNSIDGTARIIKEFQKEHPEVVYVFEPVRSRGSARNAGISRVTGEIIVMTDVDCIVPVDWARRLSEPISKKEELVVTGYQYNLLPNNYWAREMQRKCDYFLNYKTTEPGYISFTDTKNLAVKAELMKELMFDARFIALEDVDLEMRLRPIARFRFLPEVKVGHAHSSSARAVWHLAYERSYWYAQLYHKFKGVHDRNGVLIFDHISPWRFYFSLLHINFSAIKTQGLKHLLFFIVFDGAWKVGSAVGFARVDKSIR